VRVQACRRVAQLLQRSLASDASRDLEPCLNVGNVSPS
jgi:hypothetical protein